MAGLADKIKGGDEHILFVDDEEMLVTLAQTYLGRLGYRVTGMVSSNEALEFFRREHQSVDLVITDMTMPEMAGDVLSKNILAIKPDTPIILLTGYHKYLEENTYLDIGAKTCLNKPVMMTKLASEIREVLDS